MLLDELTARTLLGVLPQAALVIDGDGGIVDGNRAAGVLLATRSIPRSQSILRYLPEEERVRLDPLAWLRRWADHPDAPELRHVHLICRDDHGREKPVRVQVGSLPGDHRLYVVLLYDVSEEQAQRQRVRDAHRLAAQLLAMSADAIVNVDERLEITYANGSAERLFDYPRGTLIGKPLPFL